MRYCNILSTMATIMPRLDGHLNESSSSRHYSYAGQLPLQPSCSKHANYNYYRGQDSPPNGYRRHFCSPLLRNRSPGFSQGSILRCKPYPCDVPRLPIKKCRRPAAASSERDLLHEYVKLQRGALRHFCHWLHRKGVE